MQIKYPKEDKVIRISNKKASIKQKNDIEYKNQMEKLKLQINELETSADKIRQYSNLSKIKQIETRVSANDNTLIELSNRLSANEQGVDSNSIAIEQTNNVVGQVSNNLSNLANEYNSTKSVVDNHTNQILTINSNKQNRLTAGNNITIDQNNVISANISSQNISELAEQVDVNTNDIIALKKYLGLYINVEPAEDPHFPQEDEPFVPYSAGYIAQTEDYYERELELSGSTEILPPNVLFSTETAYLLDGTSGQTTANINVKLNVSTNTTQNTITFNIYDNGNLIDTSSVTLNGNSYSLNRNITNYACTTKNHNLYVVCLVENAETILTATYIKVSVNAPNVVILNKLNPYNVEYNYYTDTYYLSDCSSGILKLCEIPASELNSNSDIIWTTTNIEAQEYKLAFTTETNNSGNLVATKKWQIITHKNCCIEIINSDNQHIELSSDINKVEPFINTTENARFFFHYLSKNTVNTEAIEIRSNLSKQTKLSTFAYANQVADLTMTRQFWNHCSVSSNKSSMLRTTLDGSIQFAESYVMEGQTLPTNYKNGTNLKSYIHTFTDTYHINFNCYFKYFDKFILLPVYTTITMHLGSPIVVGTYDDYFMGANDDYFCVFDNCLHYYKKPQRE